MDDIYCKLSSGILLLIGLNALISIFESKVAFSDWPLAMIVIQIVFIIILGIASFGVFKEKYWAKIMGLVIFGVSLLSDGILLYGYRTEILGLRFYTFVLLNISGIFLLYKSISDKKKKLSFHKRKY